MPEGDSLQKAVQYTEMLREEDCRVCHRQHRAVRLAETLKKEMVHQHKELEIEDRVCPEQQKEAQ